MDNWFVKQLRYHFYHPNYLVFLLSLVSLILLPPLVDSTASATLLLDISFGFVIFIAAVYTSDNLRELLIFLLVGVILFALFIANQFNEVFNIINATLTLVFFHLVLWNLVKHIFDSKVMSLNDVYAAVSGYLVFGVVAASVFFLVESSIPNSFNIEGNPNLYDFIYFSFITLTSVGYGDMLPVTPIAKSFVILLSISGQLYLTILIGIIIGKFMVAEERIIRSMESDEKQDIP